MEHQTHGHPLQGIIRRVKEDGPDGGHVNMDILSRSVRHRLRDLMDDVSLPSPSARPCALSTRQPPAHACSIMSHLVVPMYTYGAALHVHPRPFGASVDACCTDQSHDDLCQLLPPISGEQG